MDYSPLNPQALAAYAAVMSAGSITGAARLLNRSQPAVTRLIQELEAEVGFDLFHRNGPRISPTERGVQFHEEVERLLVGMHHIRQRARVIAKGDPRPVEIAATAALAAGLVPAALALMEQRHTPSTINLQSTSAERVVQSILDRTADIAVCSLPVDHPGLELHWVGRSSMVAMVSDDDPLGECELVTARDLADRRLINMANPYRLRFRIERALAEAGLSPVSTLFTNTSINAASAARLGLGIAIVDPVTAYGLPMKGVCVRPLEFDIPFLWGTFTAAGRPASTTVTEIVRTLEEACHRVLPVFQKYTMSEMDALKDVLFGKDQPTRSQSG